MAALIPRFEKPQAETPIDTYINEHCQDDVIVACGTGLAVDYHRLFIENLYEEVGTARENREHVAYSYRPKPFLVGAVLLAVNREQDSHAWYNAGNLKLLHLITKYCAENQALDEARQHGYREVIGINTAATSDMDEIEGVTFRRTETLHYCDVCRAACRDNPLVKPETLHVTSKPDPSTYQVQTYEEMVKRYAPENEAMFQDPWTHELSKEAIAKRLALYDQMIDLRARMPAPERLESSRLAYTALAGAFI